MNPFEELINNVVDNGYCIGCGACAVTDHSPIEIKLDSNGQYQAVISKDPPLDNVVDYEVNEVCPFSRSSVNEDNIARDIFDESLNYKHKIGYYDKLYAGYVLENDFRVNGSSGGFGSWIASELLKNKMVDEVIHVKGGADNMKFKYSVSQTVEEIKEGSKSRYYPVEMSEVLDYVKEERKEFAIVGIPCFIKSVRLLAKQNEQINRSIKYTIGLVCGHLKSSLYSQMLAWEMGIEPDSDFDIDFRKKKPGKKASDYSTEVVKKTSNDTKIREEQTNEMFGTTWGYGFFKYNACDFCDDILAETADITVGDAWLPEYTEDHMGTNIIVSRNKQISQLINEASKEDRIKIDRLKKEKIIESQAGGFRHRHNGLAYRLAIKEKNDEWIPKKRINPSWDLPIRRKLLYRLRMLIQKKSITNFKIAKKYKSLNLFKVLMSIYIFCHEVLSKLTIKKIKRKLLKIFQ